MARRLSRSSERWRIHRCEILDRKKVLNISGVGCETTFQAGPPDSIKPFERLGIREPSENQGIEE